MTNIHLLGFTRTELSTVKARVRNCLERESYVSKLTFIWKQVEVEDVKTGRRAFIIRIQGPEVELDQFGNDLEACLKNEYSKDQDYSIEIIRKCNC